MAVSRRSCPDAEFREASCKDAFRSHRTYLAAVGNVCGDVVNETCRKIHNIVLHHFQFIVVKRIT